MRKRPPPRGLVPMTPLELRSEFQREANERRTLTSVEVTPDTMVVVTGATQQFLATGRDPNGAEIPVTPRWSVDGEGSVDLHGLYTAGGSAGAASVVAKVRGGPSGVATVSVVDLPISPDEPGTPQVFPSEVLVQPGADYQFVLLVDGEEAAADSWDCTGGTIDSGGLFTAGVTSGQFTVTATLGAEDGVATAEVAAFDPRTDVPDLFRWCEVNDMALGDGDPMPTLDDTSGGGNDLVNALPANGAPTYQTNVQNGYAAAETDGIANVRFRGDVPFGAHTTLTACRILAGGDHGDYCVPKQRWAEGVGTTILRFLTGTSLNQRWYITTPATGLFLGGDSLNWSLLTDRLVSDTVQELSVNDGAVATLTPVTGMWDGPEDVQDRILAHSVDDAAKMQLLLDAHFTAAMTDTELRKTRRWINGRYRMY